ncbi:hypothetical protein [Pseudomonas fluorescens]|uniref:hypothetical protein n=1 Tax=Pseudomonas fluorescens TaxID=294 RepID=UPI00118511AE|nr:hypothetical protein [Pseudomonas fluorescens]
MRGTVKVIGPTENAAACVTFLRDLLCLFANRRATRMKVLVHAQLETLGSAVALPRLYCRITGLRQGAVEVEKITKQFFHS